LLQLLLRLLLLGLLGACYCGKGGREVQLAVRGHRRGRHAAVDRLRPAAGCCRLGRWLDLDLRLGAGGATARCCRRRCGRAPDGGLHGLPALLLLLLLGVLRRHRLLLSLLLGIRGVATSQLHVAARQGGAKGCRRRRCTRG
jgi:hypothetical protein